MDIATSIIIAILGALVGILTITKKGGKGTTKDHIESKSKADESRQNAQEKSDKISKEIADESKANIVKRFFNAFSHGPYTDDSSGDNNFTGVKRGGPKGSSKGTGGNGN